MIFSIEYDKQPLRFLKKAEKHIAIRIVNKIEELLKSNLVPHEAKVVVGEHGVFRLRIGDYRALYRLNYQEKRIVVFCIDKRSKVYD